MDKSFNLLKSLRETCMWLAQRALSLKMLPLGQIGDDKQNIAQLKTQFIRRGGF